MHERSIARALLDRVAAESAARGALRVVRISVRVGELSGVDPDLLASAYEATRAGTICEAAPMILHRVETSWRCPVCARAFDRGEPLRCEACGQPASLAAGDEMTIDRIEMEVPDV